jgi:DNA-binding response OmpR family regulator
MNKARVLVVDDAEEVADLVAGVLEGAGIQAQVARDGRAGLDAARQWRPDVVVLDLGLPDVDGLEVCRQLRTFSDAHVIMLTAKSDEIDRVVGLTVGADDYVTKPFSARELAARVEAALRRRRAATPAPTAAADRTRRFGDLAVDVDAREVRVAAAALEMTKIEFDILDALTENPRLVLSRAQLRERVWGGGWFGDDHAVDVHVSNLRRKLASAGAPSVVATVRGVGYRLSPALTAGA